MTAATEKPQTQPQTEPVDVLVEMAREGEIDPWDVDIVEVTDKFLQRLDEGDLVRSGRALLYASILLRMKSDYVVEEDEEEDEDPAMEWRDGRPPDEAFDDGIDALEAEFERRLDRRRVRDKSRPETLDELVRELRERERGSWWKEKREYDTSPEEGIEFRPERAPEPTTEDAMSTAHEDDIEARVDAVRDRLADEFEHRDELLFAELRGENKRETVTTYIALQFLAMRDGVRLEQDEFYGDLWIKSERENGDREN
ncbi:MAG: segregation/condensation protein A [Halobacteriales archaeon]